MVYAGVLIWMEAFKILLPNIHHRNDQERVDGTRCCERGAGRDRRFKSKKFAKLCFRVDVTYQAFGGMTSIGPWCLNRD